MHLVADASVLVESVRTEGGRCRAWLVRLLQGDDMHIVTGLTHLEISSALRSLVRRGANPDWASRIHDRLIELPATSMPLTQAMMRRIWELHGNHTPYDAAYIALAEALQSSHGARTSLVTADAKLAESPRAGCRILLYPRDENL